MFRIICISVILIFTLISCASSTRFPSRHSAGDDADKSSENRYGRSEEGNKQAEFDDKSSSLESRVGVASYYSDKYQGKETSSGEIFDQNKLTAAHSSYAIGTIVRVKNLKNRKTVVVRINDRITNLNGRLIDLSKKAAEEIDMIKEGIAKVQIDVLKWGNSN